jgi:archaellum component FlaF (FlaF/FlaG flagellin family)
MKNTILIIILLCVSLFLFKKTNEGFESATNTKNKLVNNMDETTNKMKRDYKVFNDETAIMATDQYNKFMILSIVTILVLIGTIGYAKL